MELNGQKPQVIMGIMEHAAAWVSHVLLSCYNTQTGGLAEGKKKKKEMRKCGLEFAQGLCLT